MSENPVNSSNILPQKKTSNEIVKYQNELNQVTLRRFSAVDMNIFFSVVSRVRDQDTNEVVLSYSYLKKLAKYKKHDDFTNYLKGVSQKLQKLSVEKDDGVAYRSFILFTEFVANRETQTLTVSVNPKFTFYFNQLQSEFTRFSLNQYTNFASSYSKTAFRLIKQYRTLGKRSFTVEQFRRLLDIPKSYRITDIDRRIIKMIKEEVTPVIPGLQINKIYTHGKRGNKVAGYEFTWKPESPKANDFALNKTLEQITALANIEHNSSLTEEERYRAIDRIKGLELGTTARQKEAEKNNKNNNARVIDAEVIDKKSEGKDGKDTSSDFKRLSDAEIARMLKQLNQKKGTEAGLTEDEGLKLASLAVIQRQRELGIKD